MNRKLISIGIAWLIALFFIPNFVHALTSMSSGPWLWMIAPTEPDQGGAASIDIDSIALASGGAVTESDVAAYGAKEGDKVGNYAWTLGRLVSRLNNNVNECLNQIGLTTGNIKDHSCYALFTLRCETAWNDITMQFYGHSDDGRFTDAIKVWLNGKVVHVNRFPDRFLNEFQVDFVAGDNLLMVKMSELGHDGMSMDVYISSRPQPTQQVQRPIVRLVYFRASDTVLRPDADAEIDALIKKAQRFYADEMERHGFGRKTFQFETDASGNAVVHHVVGKSTAAYYQKNLFPWNGSQEAFDLTFKRIINVYMIAGIKKSVCGRGHGNGVSGWADIYCWSWSVIAHELGHAFGLHHDFRGPAYIMSYSGWQDGLSKCAAELLNMSPAFRTDQTVFKNQGATIKMLPPSLAAPPNAIRLRFEVTDPNGIYQAQLLTPTTDTSSAAYGFPELLSCKVLNGSTNAKVEFVTDLAPNNMSVSLMVIDVHGNFAWHFEKFPIDVISLLPPPKAVSISDATLALAVRQALNLSSSQTLTTHAMLDLTSLIVENSRITDLTGLEHAYNLRALNLNVNNISDVSLLTDMTKLKILNLWGSNISDVSPLAGMTILSHLNLGNNNISDVSPLVALNIRHLTLSGNPLSYDSINTHIPAMQAKGVEVAYENVAYPALYKVSGNNQKGFAGSVLSSPFVVEAQSENGEPMEGISITFTVKSGNGQLISPTAITDADGRAQTKLMLGWTPGWNTVRVRGGGIVSWATFSAIGMEPETQIAVDVNRNGIVDVEDLVLVAATIGTTPPVGTIPNTDVNGDGVVNSDDLALVMAALETSAAAPAAVLTAENLQRWIDEAKQLINKDEIFLKGIAVLEQLLSTLLPNKTVLLANYPNPFNPETWIPYHLAKSAEVTVRIYAVNGTLIRALALGHKPAGIYEHRNRAAHWDGRNAQGERVASGIYFYTLTANDFTSTRKMLIRK